jgi:excisionase family DNA binding protein
MRMQPGNRPLTLREAADALALSVHTLRAWVSRKQIKHLRLGRAIRILPDDVEELLRRSMVQAHGVLQSTDHSNVERSECAGSQGDTYGLKPCLERTRGQAQEPRK